MRKRRRGRQGRSGTGLRKRIMGSGHPVVPLMEERGRERRRLDGSHPVKWPEHSRTFLRLSGERRRQDEGRRRRVAEGGKRAASGGQIWTAGAI